MPRCEEVVSRSIIAILIAVLLSPAIGAGAERHDPKQLLELLRARDATIDNVELKYAESQVVTIPNYEWRGRKGASDPGVAQQYAYTCHDQLVVRGVDVTLIRTRDDKRSETSAGFKVINPYQKNSNTNQLLREMVKFDMEGRGHTLLEIGRSGLPVDPVRQEAMQAEFAHGLGLGKRIKEIEEVCSEDGRIIIKGTIGIWWDDVSRFEAELDDNLIVRRASIHSDVRGRISGFEVTTEGTIAYDGTKLAVKGTFCRYDGGVTWLDGRTGGKRSPHTKVTIENEGLNTHLSDDTYQKLISFPMEPGMQVVDNIAGTSYFIDSSGQPELKHIDLSSLANLAQYESPLSQKAAFRRHAEQVESVGIAKARPETHSVRRGVPLAQTPTAVWWYTAGSAIVILLAAMLAMWLRMHQNKRKGVTPQ